jgi:Putative type VII ESX secretion system translocon, EccE
VSEERVTYRFGPLERRGLLGPFRASQVIPVVLAAISAVIVLDTVPSATGAVAALALIGAALMAATVPLGGGTFAEWAPTALRHAARRSGGRARFRSPLPSSGFRMSGADIDEPMLPPALAGVTLRDVPYRQRQIGVLADNGGRLLTAALACRVSAFDLLDRDAQERRLAQWGAVLRAAAGTPIRRLQWIERTTPAQGDELAQWLHQGRDPSVPPRGSALVESYLELIGTTALVMHEHEILVAVQVDGSRIRGDAQAALIDQAQRIARGLEDAQINVLGALTARQLSHVIRTGFDPYIRPELAASSRDREERAGLDKAHAGPLAAQERWDHLQADGACHATYWIGGWPRIEVGPMFMNALLGPSGPMRTVAVCFEPIPAERSTREVEAALTRDRADREVRRRFGQAETARHRLAQHAAENREAELAAGHGEVRFAGYVTVSGRDPDELRQATADTLQQAARAHLELHRLYGEQAEAFTFTLPLARGLR